MYATLSIALSARCLDSIWSVAIFAEVTWLAAICIVSILPDTISDESTALAAMCPAFIVPFAM